MPTPLQVLVLEDRQSDAELMIKELSKAGYVPDWRRVDTEHAFRQRITPSLNLVLMDYTLPQWTAADALAVLRESSVDVPAIVVSGSLGDERAVECLKLGAADYVLKDRMARLGPAVQRAIEDRRLRIERTRTLEALRRSEEQLRSILTTVEDVVWSLSLETGRLLYLNPAAAKLTGRPVGEFLSDPQAWLTSVHPEDHAMMAKAQEAAIRWGTYEGEFRLVRPDESVRNVLVRAWAAYGVNGKPQRLEGIFTDITDKRVAEEKRFELELARREARRLTQVNRFKSDLLNMVAHDLNNVLAPLKVNAFLLTQTDELKPDDRELAREGLERSIKRMGEFLADLLDTARLQSGQLVLRCGPFDAAATIRRLVETYQPEAKRRTIQLAVETPQTGIVQADERRIEQVVNNLLTNALKFTEVGGRVIVRAEATGGHLLVAVQDTGVGLAEEDIQKLFQPFARVGRKPQGTHTGTGLGLYISKGIAEAHGGTVWCKSAGPGKGATFLLQIPTATSPLAGPAGHASRRERDGPPNHLVPGRQGGP